MQVKPGSDPRLSSEEAAWLADTTGLPVWVTRDRLGAWNELARLGSLDVLVCDDGFEDPRLCGARRILLDWGDHASDLRDLIPMGPCRSWLRDHADAEVWACNPPHDVATPTVRLVPDGLFNARGDALSAPAVLVCGIGDPERLVREVLEQGATLRRLLVFRDHAHSTTRAIVGLLGHGEQPILCTEKDLWRLPPALRSDPRIFVARQRVSLPVELTTELRIR